jgi:hypothetical protein
MAGEFEKLKSLMDEQYIDLPPDSEPEPGQAYMDRIAALGKDIQSQEQILKLTSQLSGTKTELLGNQRVSDAVFVCTS